MSYLLGSHIPHADSLERHAEKLLCPCTCVPCVCTLPLVLQLPTTLSAGVRSHPSPAALSPKCLDEWRGTGQVTLELSYWVFHDRKDV